MGNLIKMIQYHSPFNSIRKLCGKKKIPHKMLFPCVLLKHRCPNISSESKMEVLLH